MERAAPTRLLSLDVVRGLTIAGMLLVNDPGSWGAIYALPEHAEWNGWTPADLVIPFFLVCGALLTTTTSLTEQVISLAVLLYGYWFLQTLVPVSGRHEIEALFLSSPGATLCARLDRVLLGDHVRVNSGTWNSVGILCTMPAIGTVILGVLCGRWLTHGEVSIQERLDGMFVVTACSSSVRC